MGGGEGGWVMASAVWFGNGDVWIGAAGDRIVGLRQKRNVCCKVRMVFSL